jgi:hypothetical protein
MIKVQVLLGKEKKVTKIRIIHIGKNVYYINNVMCENISDLVMNNLIVRSIENFDSSRS